MFGKLVFQHASYDVQIIRFVAPEDRFRVAFASKKEAEIHLSLRDVEEVVKLDSW